ncbi:hypothetical protein [Thiohalocapsa sp. ML1]|jgi:hypothetical protein|uniref:hypothetical protein n=1 Tax=Thiohalocapsa sp. ML1 TaxID=1431688 RepID=UPI0007321692|nr:hypothetical protein [Thiohalocapsa sp. ML1]
MASHIEPEALLELYRKVAASQQAKLPPMEPRTYDLAIPEAPPLNSAEAARARLVAFKPSQGWVGFQSANRVIDERGVPDMDDQTGWLLAAEACNTDGASMHIRYDGAGGWQVTEYRQSVGGPYLSDIVTQVAHKVSLGAYLRYRRFWRIDPMHGAQIHAACFIGFGDDR